MVRKYNVFTSAKEDIYRNLRCSAVKSCERKVSGDPCVNVVLLFIVSGLRFLVLVQEICLIDYKSRWRAPFYLSTGS